MPRDVGFLIGEKLVQKGILNINKLKDAIEKQKLSGKLLGEVIVDLGYASEEQIAQAVSEQIGIPYVDINRQKITKDAIELLPETIAREYMVFPLFRLENSITIAMKDPLDIRVIDRLNHLTRCD
ncbi:MAG: type II secretion system protein GspE, partial [Candidatus Omnitrophica bacterium]|nr:type II secretion system protein GspE [Candidatus Omnitrophota bacterium]